MKNSVLPFRAGIIAMILCVIYVILGQYVGDLIYFFDALLFINAGLTLNNLIQN